MNKYVFLALVGIILGIGLLHPISATTSQDDIRRNVLVNGSKYKYQSFVEVGKGKYIPLSGMGLMIVPEGEVPQGVIGSVAAIFSSGYQARAKAGLTGPQEVLVAKRVIKTWGKKGLGTEIKSTVVDKSKLKEPINQ